MKKKNSILLTLTIILLSIAPVWGQYPDFEPIDPYPNKVGKTVELVRIDFADPSVFDSFQASHNVKLEKGVNVLKTIATGDDPYFRGPVFSKEDSQKLTGPLLFKIRIRSKQTKSIELFWSEEKVGNFTPERSQQSGPGLRADNQWHDCYLPIVTKSPMTCFRLDPGGKDQSTEIASISICRLYPPEMEIKSWKSENGILSVELINNSKTNKNWSIQIENTPISSTIFQNETGKTANLPKKSEEIAENERQSKKYPIAIKAGERTIFKAVFSKKKMFESKTVTFIDSEGTQLTRTFYACHFDVSEKFTVLKSNDLEVKFAQDGSGALVYRSGKCAAVITPLVFDNIGASQILFDNFNPFASVKPDNRISDLELRLRSQPGNKSANSNIVFEFSNRNDASKVRGSLAFRLKGTKLAFRLKSDRPVCGPTLRPIGVMKQAMLSGAEYLEEGEYSSSTADIITPERIRLAPPTFWITAPLAVIVTDRASCVLSYKDSKNRPIFAVPDFVDRMSLIADSKELPKAVRQLSESKQANPIAPWHYSHRLGLYGNSLDGTFTIGAPDVMENLMLTATQDRELPPLPELPRTKAEQDKLNLDGFLKSTLHTPDGKWVHATAGQAGLGPFKPLYSSDFCSAIYEVTGKLPDVQQLEMGGGHIANFMSWFVSGQSQTLLNSLNSGAAALRKAQRSDGSFGYSGKYLKGHWKTTSSGHTANYLYTLGRHWALTGDQESLKALLKGCDYINTLKTPRGAQVWELSLHTPDVMGSSRALLANTYAYEATKDTKYLNAARRWAVSGLPFVYLWDIDLPQIEEPVIGCRYATIAVFGATNWKSPNWMGRPVQWCGLDYAWALLRFAPYDRSLDWKKIAEGIVISGERQQYTEGISIGLLPDSYNMDTQKRNAYDINPSVLHLLHRLLRGEQSNIIVKTNADGHRIVSPFPVEIKGNKAVITAKKNTKYDVWVNNKVKKIVSNGTDSVSLK